MPDQAMPEKITFIYQGKKNESKILDGFSLLDIALQSKVDPPYSCMEGVCRSCLAKLVMGEVEYRQGSPLTAKEAKEGKVLTCQAMPMKSSGDLIVDYDLA